MTEQMVEPAELVDPREALAEANGTIDFLGQDFVLAPKMSAMPLLKFGLIAKNGAGIEDLETLVVIRDIIFATIDRSDHAAFEAHAEQECADINDMMALVKRAIGVMAARPTRRPSGSPAGPQDTATNSSADSSSQESLTPLMAQRREFLRVVRPIDELSDEMSGTG